MEWEKRLFSLGMSSKPNKFLFTGEFFHQTLIPGLERNIYSRASTSLLAQRNSYTDLSNVISSLDISHIPISTQVLRICRHFEGFRVHLSLKGTVFRKICTGRDYRTIVSKQYARVRRCLSFCVSLTTHFVDFRSAHSTGACERKKKLEIKRRANWKWGKHEERKIKKIDLNTRQNLEKIKFARIWNTFHLFSFSFPPFLPILLPIFPIFFFKTMQNGSLPQFLPIFIPKPTQMTRFTTAREGGC